MIFAITVHRFVQLFVIADIVAVAPRAAKLNPCLVAPTATIVNGECFTHGSSKYIAESRKGSGSD